MSKYGYAERKAMLFSRASAINRGLLLVAAGSQRDIKNWMTAEIYHLTPAMRRLLSWLWMVSMMVGMAHSHTSVCFDLFVACLFSVSLQS